MYCQICTRDNSPQGPCAVFNNMADVKPENETSENHISEVSICVLRVLRGCRGASKGSLAPR